MGMEVSTTRTRGRWKGKSAEQVSRAMRALARKRHDATTPEERKKVARKLVDARGSWVIKNGKKVYVRRSGKK